MASSLTVKIGGDDSVEEGEWLHREGSSWQGMDIGDLPDLLSQGEDEEVDSFSSLLNIGMDLSREAKLGHGDCCKLLKRHRAGPFLAIGEGDLQHVKPLLNYKPKLVNGPLPVLACPTQKLLLLENGAMVDALNSYKQINIV